MSAPSNLHSTADYKSCPPSACNSDQGISAIYQIRPAPGLLGKLFRRAPGWVVNGFALAAMLGILYAMSAPGGYTLEGLIGCLLWCLMASIWLIRAGGFLICTRLLRAPASPRNGWRPWLIGPLASAITLGLVFLEVPLRVGFALSRNDLSRISRQALAAPPSHPQDFFSGPVQRAGIYRVSIVTLAGEVRFRVHGTEFFRSFSGFSYCPAGTPEDGGGSFEPLDGPWYQWHTSW